MGTKCIYLEDLEQLPGFLVSLVLSTCLSLHSGFSPLGFIPSGAAPAPEGVGPTSSRRVGVSACQRAPAALALSGEWELGALGSEGRHEISVEEARSGGEDKTAKVSGSEVSQGPASPGAQARRPRGHAWGC